VRARGCRGSETRLELPVSPERLNGEVRAMLTAIEAAWTASGGLAVAVHGPCRRATGG
jgi:hypothetical protein